MFLNSKDWKCPKCKTENYIGDSVNDVATSKSLEYLENYNIEVPFICDKCGFKEVLLVAYDLAKNRYEVDYEDTAFCNKDTKWRDKLLKEAGLITGNK
ncbi:hypothetical protein [Lactobacillus gasseri]|uniref:hypothetical protein n=1 Tax=Lactobacillus gasseri TaxID=1596 RepID=UPI001BFF1A8F|nr:hypothetical protein [Lactobacillus gasseri]